MVHSKMTATAGSIVGEFVRILPENIRRELDVYAESLTSLDLVGALNALDDSGLQAVLRSCAQARIGAALTRLGVDNYKGRPRVPGLLVAKLIRGLSRGEMSAKLVLQLLTDGVYKLLLVQAAGLSGELPPDWYCEELDTPVLRALAVLGVHRLNDPSAPWVLACMVRGEDPAVKILVKPDAMEPLELSTGQFLQQARPEQHEVLREWVRRRAVLPTLQDKQWAAAVQEPAQKTSASPRPNSSLPGTGVTTGTDDNAPSLIASSPAPSSVTPGSRPPRPADESHEMEISSALSLLNQEFAEAASVLLPRLSRALIESYA